MYLTLEVVSPQAASMGADRRRTVGPQGLTIGRVPGNDWVIPDPYISKQHARITYANGAFFVESLGRNAVAIGNANNTLPGNTQQPLRTGDHLFVDQYEIIVGVMQGDVPRDATVANDPFKDAAPAGLTGQHSRPSPPGVISGAEFGPAFADTGVLDPLTALGMGSRTATSEPLPPVNWQQSSALEDHFQPPPVPAPVGVDPFDLLEPDRASAPSVAPPPPAGIPDNWDRTSLNKNPAESAPAVRPVPRPNAPAPTGRPVIPAQQVQAVSAVPVASAPPVASGLGADLAELMRGAGLSEQNMSPETLRDLGKVLRVVVEGVMDVLRARTEIKSQFRLPLTRIQSVDNNPLKHSPNVESALHTLLVLRNPGYLTAVEAFEDAFADIRNHQMAMLEGVRTAFESMLASFDPAKLEKQFDSAGKRGLSFGGAKSKYWDLYGERFTRLGGDADDTFRRLFGDVFADAYEKQLERLKTGGNGGGT